MSGPSINDILRERVRRERVRRSARGDFLSFTEYTKPNYETNWHHAALARKLEWWVDTPGAKLIVCMPPRHGKSELVSRRLPAYIFGRHPNSDIIATSYAQDLANSMSRDVQSIMDDAAYLSLFPGSRRPFRGGTRKSKDTISEWGLAHRTGSYKAAGVGAGITGRGFDFGIIDDPIKNDDEAQSPRARDRVWYWYHSTFATRREPGARTLITMTRWHQDDLVGRLLDSEDDWETIILPCVKEDAPTIDEDPREVGGLLWPSRFGPERVAEAQKIQRVWNAAYRQSPSEGEGNVFKKGMFQRYDHLPAGDEAIVEYVLSIDAAFKDTAASSRVSLQLWGRGAGKPRYFLLEDDTDQMGFLATIKRSKEIVERWPESKGRLVVLIEDKANGPAIIEAMGRTFPSIIPVTPRESKVARAQAVLPVFVSRCVYVPTESYLVRGTSPAFWARPYIDELKEFPYHAYNDRVDATSQVLLYFIENAWDLNFGRLDQLEDDESEMLIGDDSPNGNATWLTPF